MKKISIVTIIILLLVAVPQNSVQAATKVTNIGHCLSLGASHCLRQTRIYKKGLTYFPKS